MTAEEVQKSLAESKKIIVLIVCSVKTIKTIVDFCQPEDTAPR
jgi:hypothetical protein